VCSFVGGGFNFVGAFGFQAALGGLLGCGIKRADSNGYAAFVKVGGCEKLCKGQDGLRQPETQSMERREFVTKWCIKTAQVEPFAKPLRQPEI